MKRRPIGSTVAGTLALTLTCAVSSAQPGTCPPALALTAEALQSARMQARDRGFLWRIDKAGRSSWLYGTVPTGRLEWAFPGPLLRQALAAADALVVDLDPADAEATSALAQALATRLPPGPLPAREQQRLARGRAALCLEPAAFDAQHPLLRALSLAVLGSRFDGLDPAFAPEAVLAQAAHGAGVPVIALQTPAGAAEALFPVDRAAATALLTRLLDQVDRGSPRRAALKLAQHWAAGELEDAAAYAQWCDCLPTAADRTQLEALTSARNPAIAERIDRLHLQGRRLFVALGVLNMTGPQALPGLLMERGYAVERIEFSVPGAR
jgi:hypothetical protein